MWLNLISTWQLKQEQLMSIKIKQETQQALEALAEKNHHGRKDGKQEKLNLSLAVFA